MSDLQTTNELHTRQGASDQTPMIPPQAIIYAQVAPALFPPVPYDADPHTHLRGFFLEIRIVRNNVHPWFVPGSKLEFKFTQDTQTNVAGIFYHDDRNFNFGEPGISTRIRPIGGNGIYDIGKMGYVPRHDERFMNFSVFISKDNNIMKVQGAHIAVDRQMQAANPKAWVLG